MAEAFPIIERIAKALFARVETVTVENGYQQDALAFRPTALGGYSPQHLAAVMVQGESIKDQLNSFPGNPPAIARDQDFHFLLFACNSDKDTTPIEQTINVFAADVSKAITTVESGDWVTFGGLSIGAWIADPVWFPVDVPYAGVDVKVTIKYRTSEYDPYTQR